VTDSAGATGTVIKNTLRFSDATVILSSHQLIIITGAVLRQHCVNTIMVVWLTLSKMDADENLGRIPPSPLQRLIPFLLFIVLWEQLCSLLQNMCGTVAYSPFVYLAEVML
jgi:hypothetical protein